MPVFFRFQAYIVISGACRNENGEYKDKGAVNVGSLLSCLQKCDATQGCRAVSWNGTRCFMTSYMARTTTESKWKCYWKGKLRPIFSNLVLKSY